MRIETRASSLEVNYAKSIGLSFKEPIGHDTLREMVHEREQSMPATRKQREIALRIGIALASETSYFEAQTILREKISERNALAMRHKDLQAGKFITYTDGRVYKVVRPGRRAGGYMATLEPKVPGRGNNIDLPLYLLFGLKTERGSEISPNG